MTTPQKTNVPERYVKALDGADPVHVLRKTPKRLRKLLRDAKDKELAWKEDAATWSVQEVMGHLADHEFVFGARIRFVAAEDRPLLPGYDEKRFLANLGVDRCPIEDLFDVWMAARSANVHLLDRLPESAWTKIGVHSERGELSLLQIVVGNAGHDRVHEEQIERTIARARAARREAKAAERAADAAAKTAKKQSRAEQKSASAAAAKKKSARKAADPARETAQATKAELRGKDSAKAAKAPAAG